MSIHRSSDLPLSGQHSLPEGYFRVNRCRRCGIVIGYGERCDVCLERREHEPDGIGEYVGRHHTEWVPTVDELLIQGNDDDAEFLLWKLIEAAEAETYETGVAPYERHFTRLIQLAQRRKDSALAGSVRERYERCRRAVRDPKSEAS